MITLKRIVVEKSQAIKSWVDNCGRNGTAILNRFTVQAFLKRYDISEREFNDFINNEYNFEIVNNDDHYILSRSELRKIF